MLYKIQVSTKMLVSDLAKFSWETRFYLLGVGRGRNPAVKNLLIPYISKLPQQMIFIYSPY